MSNAMIDMKIWDNDSPSNIEHEVYIPPNYVLSQNYPNLFNPLTNISYDVSKRSHVSIRIFDAFGKLLTTLVDDIKSAGSYNVKFHTSNLPSGMYILQMQVDDYIGLKKMMLIK
jgi:hypothetical protein